jgi:hypothetical protein
MADHPTDGYIGIVIMTGGPCSGTENGTRMVCTYPKVTTASIEDVDGPREHQGDVSNNANDCSIINNLDHAVTGIVSAGLKAVALVSPANEIGFNIVIRAISNSDTDLIDTDRMPTDSMPLDSLG